MNRPRPSGPPSLPKTIPSRLAELRYGQNADRDNLVEACAAELRRFFRVGKVPWDVARDALDIAQGHILDELMVDCPSWAESPWFDVHRGWCQ